MQFIDGKNLAKKIRQEVKSDNMTIQTDPQLAVFLIGDDPASLIYIKKKQEAANEIDVVFTKYTYNEKTEEDIIIDKIHEINEDPAVHGILVQLPLPKWYNTDKIIAQIDPAKDVDGFHPENIKKMKENKDHIIPPVIMSIVELIKATKTDQKGKTAVALANSDATTPEIP